MNRNSLRPPQYSGILPTLKVSAMSELLNTIQKKVCPFIPAPSFSVFPILENSFSKVKTSLQKQLSPYTTPLPILCLHQYQLVSTICLSAFLAPLCPLNLPGLLIFLLQSLLHWSFPSMPSLITDPSADPHTCTPTLLPHLLSGLSETWHWPPHLLSLLTGFHFMALI